MPNRSSLAIPVTLLVIFMVSSVDLSADIGVGTGTLPKSVFEMPSSSIGGLLDPAKLDMSHSISFGYSSAAARYGDGYSGLYQNRLNYKIADPLDLTITLGYAFASPYDQGELSQKERIIPGFALRYQPSDNLLMQISYRAANAYAGRPLSFGERYYGAPWDR